MRKTYKLTDEQANNLAYYLFANNQINRLEWVKVLGSGDTEFEKKMNEAYNKHVSYRIKIEDIIKEVIGDDYAKLYDREVTNLNELTKELTITWRDEEN